MKKYKIPIVKLLSLLLILPLVSGILFIGPVPATQAAETGWRNPSTDEPGTGGDGDGFEELPTAAYADSGDYARNLEGVGDRHRFYNYGFDATLPADAEILGIEVRLDGWVDHAASDPHYEVELSWDGGSNWSSPQATPRLGGSETTHYLGAQNDLWGHVWSASELTDANFRLRITSLDDVWDARHFYLDWVAVRVHYASAHITGTVWSDEDADGVRDEGEPGLENVHVTIYQDDGDEVFEGGSQDIQAGSDDTDADGAYDTGPFMDGFSYWIDVDPPPDHTLTTPPEPRLVDLVDGSSVTVDFGYAPETANPAIEIAKSPDAQTVVSGTSATFTIAVTNTGDVSLSSVTVSDPLVPDCDRDLGELASGASQRYDCSLTGVTEDLTNTATAAGTPPVGDPVSDTDTASVDVINPAIQIAKSPDAQTVIGGATATFTIAVTNTGDVSLSSVTVSDPLSPDCDRVFANLASGASQSYSCTFTDVTESFTNTATVHGTPSIGPDVTDTDSAAVVKQNDTQACPAGLSAYWRLDESEGTTFEDYYDSHTGQCAGQCPIPTTAGRVNGGQVFDGTSTGINVPAGTGASAFDWGVDDSFSVEFWLKRPGVPTGNEVIIGRDDPATSLHWWAGVGHWAGDVAIFCLYDIGGTGACIAGDTILTDGDWHHLVAVRDASAGEIRLYVDGAEENVESVTYASDFGSESAALNIGWLNLGQGYHFEGIIDEGALYDTALASQEIEDHYRKGLAERWYCQSETYAPVFISAPITEAKVGFAYEYDAEAMGDPLPSYALLTKPLGMTIDAYTGLISWIPTVDQEGQHAVEVEAANSEGQNIQRFSINVDSGVIAYWKLNETSGTIYEDSHDGHDGHCAGDCPVPTSGYRNGGQAFNGVSSGINVPPHAVFDWEPTQSFSVEFWMKTESASTCQGNQVIVGRDDSSTGLHWWVGCHDGGEAAFVLIDTDGTSASTLGTSDLTDGRWHHVVAVRDAEADEMRLYVDWVEESVTTATYGSDFGSSTAAVNIGWLNLSHGYHFHGVLDEVTLHDVALPNLAPSLGEHQIFLPLILRH